MAGHLRQINFRRRAQMDVHLDARQRKQVIDQALHALGLAAHEVQEFFARLFIVPRRTLERFDEARQRGQRRAQFMAGIGHEIRAHALDLLFARQILEHQKNRRACPTGPA